LYFFSFLCCFGGRNNFSSHFAFLLAQTSMLATWLGKPLKPVAAGEGGVEMNEIILAFLFLGSARAAVVVDLLRERGITHVLTVTDTLPRRTQQAFGPTHHIHIDVADIPGEPLSRHFAKAIAFIGVWVFPTLFNTVADGAVQRKRGRQAE
jgi:hypothetical protein